MQFYQITTVIVINNSCGCRATLYLHIISCSVSQTAAAELGVGRLPLSLLAAPMYN